KYTLCHRCTDKSSNIVPAILTNHIFVIQYLFLMLPGSSKLEIPMAISIHLFHSKISGQAVWRMTVHSLYILKNTYFLSILRIHWNLNITLEIGVSKCCMDGNPIILPLRANNPSEGIGNCQMSMTLKKHKTKVIQIVKV
ncbi:hypothetical protein L9F63_004813, partial [Diploptera punctata]